MCRRHSPICIEEESAASTYNRGTISPLCGEGAVSSVYRRGRATLSFVHMRHSILNIESMPPYTTSRGIFSPVCREDIVYSVQRRSLPPSHQAMGHSLPCVDNVILMYVQRRSLSPIHKANGDLSRLYRQGIPSCVKRKGVCLLD